MLFPRRRKLGNPGEPPRFSIVLSEIVPKNLLDSPFVPRDGHDSNDSSTTSPRLTHLLDIDADAGLLTFPTERLLIDSLEFTASVVIDKLLYQLDIPIVYSNPVLLNYLLGRV